MGNYWTILSNSVPIMIAYMFEVFIESMNIHFATNKEMMAGIGIATTLIHSVGGCIITGFRLGFTGAMSRAFGANNQIKCKNNLIQGLTNLAILLVLFITLSFASFQIVKMTGQSLIIAQYAYKTILYHLPGFCFFFLSDLLWGFMNSQKVFKPVLVIQLSGIIVHTILSLTISRHYGFNGIVISTNITFAVVFILTLFAACKYPPWKLSMQMFQIQNKYQDYCSFVKQCILVALPYFFNMFMFQFMALYIGGFRINAQTATHVALTNLQGIVVAPQLGFAVYNFTKICHFIGQNQPNKIKQSLKQTLIISLVTHYSIIVFIFIFKHKIASYYLKDESSFISFFLVLNLYIFRGLIYILKINGTYTLRAFKDKDNVIILAIFSKYAFGITSIILLCKYVFLEMKILGIWIGFFIGQISDVVCYAIKFIKMDIDQQVKELNQEVKFKQLNNNSP